MKTIHSDVSEAKIQKEIQLFNNPAFGEIRISLNESNEPLFCLADICKATGLLNPSSVKQRLDDEDVQLVDLHALNSTYPIKGNTMTNFVTESGFYDVLLQSSSPNVRPFRKWVTSEVLPSIRKSGGYMVSQEEDTPETIMARALVVAQDTLKRHAEEVIAERRLRFEAEQQRNISEGKAEILENENKHLAPKAQYTDEVLQSASTFTTTQIAQSLQMSAILLNKKLNLAGVQYKQSGQWMLYSKFRDEGYANIRIAKYLNRHTEEIESTQSLVWTEKGRMFIHDLKKQGKI